MSAEAADTQSGFIRRIRPPAVRENSGTMAVESEHREEVADGLTIRIFTSFFFLFFFFYSSAKLQIRLISFGCHVVSFNLSLS